MLHRIGRALRRGPACGIAGSLALHLLVVALALYVALPASRIQVKRGEPLFIELPDLPGSAPSGNPAAKTPGPPAGTPPAAPASPRRPGAPAVAARPAPPRPEVASGPPQAKEPPPRVARRAPEVPEAPRPAPERQVAPRAPEPAPPPPRMAPEPSPEATAPVPEPPKTPASRPPGPEPSVASPAPAPPPPAGERLPAPGVEPRPAPDSSVARKPAPGTSAPPGPQVASVPPGRPSPPAVDIRSLGRGGGGGGLGQGRGGIEGEPIPLDSTDPNYSDWLDRVRRQIKEKWGYPCVKNPVTSECEYKTAHLVVEFGVLRSGGLQFIEVREASGYRIYDDYAANAIRLGSPFPPVPEAMMTRMRRGSTGVAILASFNYLFSASLTNLLR